MTSVFFAGRRPIRVAAAALTAAALVGCSSVIDHARLEQVISDEVESQAGLTVSEVECPENRPLRAGDTFTCDATAEDRTLTITVTQQDDQGNVRWEVTGETPGTPAP